jgi:hypothetical protein
LIAPHIDDDLFIVGRDLGDEVDKIREFVRDRRDELEPELANPPGWDFDLRESFCFVTVGTVSGTFDTSFGTLSSPELFSNGTATLTGDLEGSALSPTQIGSKSGLDPDNPGNAQVQLIAQTAPNIFLVFVFNTSVANFASGTTLPLAFGPSVGLAIEFDSNTSQSRVLGLFLGGTLELDEAGTADGAAVSGSFSGDVVLIPF